MMLAKQLSMFRKLMGHYYCFSRVRGSTRQNRRNSMFKHRSEQFDIDSFDILDSLQTIQVNINSFDKEFQKSVFQLYDQSDQNCLKLLREKQEEFIIKISQGQEFYQNLSQFYHLKIRVNFRFRRWADIKVCIDNSIQILKYENQPMSRIQGKYLSYYNQLCGVYLMNDHNRLYQLLIHDQKGESQSFKKRRSGNLQEEKKIDFGLDQYRQLEHRLQRIESTHILFEKMNEIILMKVMGFFVLGMRQKGLEMLGMLMNSECSSSLKEKAYLLILTSLTFPAPSSKPISEHLWKKINNRQKFNSADIEQLSKSSIETLKSQNAVKQFLQKQRQSRLQQLPPELLPSYGRILFLICQNYYLEKNEIKFKLMQSLLRSFKDQQINFLLNYLKLGQLVDEKNFQAAKQFMEDMMQFEKEEVREEGKKFYNNSLIQFDLLRVNILKMASSIHRALDNFEQAQKYGDLADILQAKLGIYTLCEPTQCEQWQKDWRSQVSGRFPYYYLPLSLNNLFPFEKQIDI